MSSENVISILTTLVTVVSALGGWELVKWLLNRKSNQRIAEAHADLEEVTANKEEFGVLKEQIEFLQRQIYDKETRFAEQTNLVRQQNLDIINLTKEKGALELELQKKRCEVKCCPNRQPQNGY